MASRSTEIHPKCSPSQTQPPNQLINWSPNYRIKSTNLKSHKLRQWSQVKSPTVIQMPRTHSDGMVWRNKKCEYQSKEREITHQVLSHLSLKVVCVPETISTPPILTNESCLLNTRQTHHMRFSCLVRKKEKREDRLCWRRLKYILPRHASEWRGTPIWIGGLFHARIKLDFESHRKRYLPLNPLRGIKVC